MEIHKIDNESWRNIAMSVDAILNAYQQNDEEWLSQVATKHNTSIPELTEWATTTRERIRKLFNV